MENFRDKRKGTDAYERIKGNYEKIEKDRMQRLADIERQLEYRKEKRDEQLESIREKHIAKKKQEGVMKTQVTKKGKPRR